MRVSDVVAGVSQVILMVVITPFVVGMMRQVRAKLEGRSGAGIMQPWRDLRKLFLKESIRPRGTTYVFAAAPFVLAATSLLVAAAIPIVTTASPFNRASDALAVTGLLLLGTVSLALAGLDTGTAFGGMGSSRDLTISALVEPTILLSVFALSVPARTTNLSAIVRHVAAHPASVAPVTYVLVFAALLVVLLAETGRLPVDNPTTHLELTMVHEAMILEYTGSRLAVIEWASGLRLTVLCGLICNLFIPWGLSGTHASVLHFAGSVAIVAFKIAVFAAFVAGGEVFMAKLRLFRIPELVAGSFAFGVLAVTASYFLQAGVS